MIKSEKCINTFSSGVDQDTSANKRDNTTYFDSENMRIISNDSMASGAMNNIKGNILRLTFATNDQIIGTCKIRSNTSGNEHRDAIVFFVYNTLPMSKIYIFDGDPFLTEEEVVMTGALASHTASNGYTYKSGLLYQNVGLAFNPAYPIKAEGRYESAQIRKVYWVDGLNNVRYMIIDTITGSEDVTVFDINPTATLVQPTATLITGGGYTSGLVQYSYQLYIKNGAATTYSPPSDLLYLTARDGGVDSRTFSGSELNENTGKGAIVTLNNLDEDYNRVRVVAIHYKEYLVDPIINIIGEFDYDGTTLSITDNGYTTYGTIEIDEFRLFGQIDYIGNYITAKNNYLFIGDVTEERWNPTWLNPTDVSFWDARAVRYKAGPLPARVYHNDGTYVDIATGRSNWSSYVYNHDGINVYNDLDNDGDAAKEYKFRADGITLGAEGPNVTVGFGTEDLLISNYNSLYSYVDKGRYDESPAVSSKRSSQRRETYRLFLVFFNKKMQYTNPQWICDLRMPGNSDTGYLLSAISSDNLTGKYIYPTVTLTSVPVDSELYGWQIFRCERGSTDRSVLANGILSPCYTEATLFGETILRPYSDPALASPYALTYLDGSWPTNINKAVIEVISPEIAFNKNLKYTPDDHIRIEGRLTLEDANIVEFTGFGDNNSDRHVSVNMGAAVAASGTDTLKYLVNDGGLQTPGIINGDTPTYPASTIYSGTIKFKNVLRFNVGSGNRFHGNGATNFIAVLDSNMVLDESTHGFIYGSYVRNTFNTQYNGNTYEARSYNAVIPYSSFTPTTTVTQVCDRGDTFITVFAYLRSSAPNIDYSDRGNDNRYMQQMIYFPCESSINCFYRSDEIQKYYMPILQDIKLQETVEQGLVLQPTTYPIEIGDLYRYNSVYSKSASGMTIQCMVFDSNIVDHSDVKILATSKKINNEYYDNWTNFKTNNFIELDPRYGSIRDIFTFNNRMFAGQDKAIAVISVNERSLIQDNSKLSLTLGTGDVLERYDYLTTSSGFQNYFDAVTTDKSFYYLDRRNKIIYNLTGEGDAPISEVKGYRSFLKQFDTITDVITGFDPQYKEVHFYISDGVISKTSVYNEYTQSFTGTHSYAPDWIFDVNDQFYSIKNNLGYLHNHGAYGDFYNTICDSTLTAIINPSGNNLKRFDIFDLRVDVIDSGVYQEKEQFDHIELSNNYQTINKAISFTGDDSAIDTAKAIVRQWRVWLVPDDNSTEFYRLADTYLKAKFIKHNTGTKRLVFHDIHTWFRNIKS